MTIDKFKLLIKNISLFSSNIHDIEKTGLSFENSNIEHCFYTLVDIIVLDFSENAQSQFYDYVYSNFNEFSEMNDEDINEFYNILINA